MPAGAASRCAPGADGVGAARPAPAASLIRSPPRATRSAPMAWALRARAPATAQSRPRAARSAPMAWALRARALHVFPAITHALPLSGGDVDDVVRVALIETLGARRALRSCRGRGWGGVFQTLSCTSVRGNACVLAQHVQCKSARRATATGALYPQARPTSRTLSARARLHAAAVAAS